MDCHKFIKILFRAYFVKLPPKIVECTVISENIIQNISGMFCKKILEKSSSYQNNNDSYKILKKTYRSLVDKYFLPNTTRVRVIRPLP